MWTENRKEKPQIFSLSDSWLYFCPVFNAFTMKIIGTGSALPKKIVTNDMLSEFLDTSDAWIYPRTGIKTRHVISDEKLEDLAAEAARKALADAGVNAEDLDMIICSNVVNEYITPSLSCIIQGAIGATCPCLDINCACAGFIYALDIAEEDLAYLRDIAEREAINRFTTAEIHVEQHNENHISSDTDLDGIMDAWANDFAEKLDVSEEGVHE